MQPFPSAKVLCSRGSRSTREASRVTQVYSRPNLTGVSMVRVGLAAGRYSSRVLVDLPCRRIEVDEIWAFVAKKNKHVSPADDWSRVGDQYTFVALDPESKLIPSWVVGQTAMDFMDDLSSRLRNRVQPSSDGFLPCVHAVEHAFGKNGVDYGQVVKEYAETDAGRGRYSRAAWSRSARTKWKAGRISNCAPRRSSSEAT